MQLENEIATVENKKIKVANNVDALNITVEDQEKEIAEKTKHNTSCESKICSRNKEIEQNQRTIQNMKNKMAEITARTGVRKNKTHFFLFVVTIEFNYFPAFVSRMRTLVHTKSRYII